MTNSDPVMEKARKIIEAQIEAIGFDIDANARQTIASIQRHNELLDRRRGLTRLLQMHGGTPATYAPERELVG
jgi:hypothetical protein